MWTMTAGDFPNRPLTANQRADLLLSLLPVPPSGYEVIPMKRRTVLASPLTAAVVGALGVIGITESSAATTLNPNVSPGGNFNLAIWQLQLPVGSPGSPTTIQPAQLKGAGGYSNASYFWTDKTDGSMTFWAPEKGVHTPHSSYARSELREMNSNGSAANWSLAGTHKLSAIRAARACHPGPAGCR